ncbi:SDR family oxidoreductase [Pseudoxanthomonas suwonensis]|uniref:SDR family oxidoreductase n=1 Tax=Pseudoxanthomonas suwonensis TaxID=314722 RepID=UPI00055B977A|nr:SDR family oxidoreductase [Pseudoxanthomonas suwonensis]
MKFVVVGGTGLIGSKVVPRLQQQGHDVVVAAPANGIDVLTGEGLDSALVGADVVIDLSNSPAFDDATAMQFFETAGRNLLGAETRAGVGHHVALSVVGTRKLGQSGYFRAKARQEELIREAGVPYSVIHSTQFFEFIPGIIKSGAVDGSILLPAALIQPIASDEVAESVARTATLPPSNGVVEIAGPECAPLSVFVARYMRAVGDSRPIVPDTATPYFGALLEERTLVPETKPWLGRVDFGQWLQGV